MITLTQLLSSIKNEHKPFSEREILKNFFIQEKSDPRFNAFLLQKDETGNISFLSLIENCGDAAFSKATDEEMEQFWIFFEHQYSTPLDDTEKMFMEKLITLKKQTHSGQFGKKNQNSGDENSFSGSFSRRFDAFL